MSTILLIEDDRWLADGLCLALSQAGHRIVTRHNAQQALLSLEEHAIDIIILDLFLPGGNGIQFLQELRSYSDTMKLPVIVCTTAAKQVPSQFTSQFNVLTVLDKTTLTPQILRQAVGEVVIAS